MFTPALALLITLAGPSDTARVITDSARVLPDSVTASIPSIPSRLELPISLQIEADTTPRRRRKSVEVSEWYERRLRIHRYGAYATIPLFVFQAAAGNELFQKGSGAAGWARNGHQAGATALATVFSINTVTGLWNLYESRHDPAGRKLRTAHTLLLLAADAGFVATGALAGDASENESEGGSPGGGARTHRNVALASMGVATVGTAIMWFHRD